MPTLADLLRSGSWDGGDNTRQLVNALRGVAETGATLGTGALAGLVGMPYGVYKGVTSGAYGTPQGVKIAEQEAANFMARNTYQPRTEQGQEYVQKLGNLFNESKLPPVMPETAVLGAIPKQAYAAQAERAGMAAEKALEPAIMRTMERGGKPAQLLQDLAQGSVSPMDVWHGSPHGPFKKFDPSKARTGEGNATFGEGAYLAQARGTGEEYRRTLSEPELFTKGRQVKTTAGSNMDTAKAWLQDAFESGASNPFEEAISKVSSSPLKDKDSVISALQKLQSKGVEMQKGGYLYKVDLPDEQIAKMLDWDKPLSEQSEYVQNIMKNIGMPLDRTGEKAYQGVSYEMGRQKGSSQSKVVPTNPMEASKFLAEKGITGIRYLDQMSRDAGEGTSNFVVFPKYQDLLTIKEINGQPLGAYK